jgi:hypothetical protein
LARKDFLSIPESEADENPEDAVAHAGGRARVPRWLILRTPRFTGGSRLCRGGLLKRRPSTIRGRACLHPLLNPVRPAAMFQDRPPIQEIASKVRTPRNLTRKIGLQEIWLRSRSTTRSCTTRP